VDSYQKLICKIISNNQGISFGELLLISNLSKEALSDILNSLIKNNYVSQSGYYFYLTRKKYAGYSQHFKTALSLIVLFLAFFAVSQKSYAYTPKAPNIRGNVFNPKLSGYKYIDLNKIHKKVIVLNFWATWCPPCRAELPMLNRFYKRNKKNVLIIGINVNVLKNGVKNFVEQFDDGLAYPIVHANILELQDYGGINEVPQSFFIMHHKIVFHWTGQLTSGLLNAVVQKILHFESK
jgi:thiol-disulfide isomerase/thioredoxin